MPPAGVVLRVRRDDLDMANVGGHQLQQQLRKNQNFMNVNPSNELEEESICQDAVQNFEGRGPGPGSEHWSHEESNDVFDAEDDIDQLQRCTQEA